MTNALYRPVVRHILNTGQVHCYDITGNEIACQDSGQDAEDSRGILWPSTRFAAQGEVVLDHATGLQWTRDANIGGFPCTWPEAFDCIAALNKDYHAGYDDWRLPNRNELRSLVSYQAKNPALPAGHPFVNIFLGWYWSSTTAAIHPAYAWSVHFEGARMFYGRKDQAYLFWPVRGPGNGVLPATGQHQCFATNGRIIECSLTGQDGGLRQGTPWPAPRFLIAGDLVHDCLTNLFWPRHADLTGEVVDWQQALESVAQWRRTRGHEDKHWRLPTINELASLFDCSACSPALPLNHPFTGVQPSYWTSTTSFFETDWAWVAYADKGACGVGHKPGKTFYVWPVGFLSQIAFVGGCP